MRHEHDGELLLGIGPPVGAAHARPVELADGAKQSQILFGQTARVQHVATLRLEWLVAHETLSLSSLGLVNFTTHEWLITPRIGWKMTDTITAYVGAQVFAGPDDTLFGLIDQTLSAGYAELRASF